MTQGKTPLRSRARYVYEKSGKEGTLGALGTATAKRYKMAGKPGQTFAVQLENSSPLRSGEGAEVWSSEGAGVWEGGSRRACKTPHVTKLALNPEP